MGYGGRVGVIVLKYHQNPEQKRKQSLEWLVHRGTTILKYPTILLLCQIVHVRNEIGGEDDESSSKSTT